MLHLAARSLEAPPAAERSSEVRPPPASPATTEPQPGARRPDTLGLALVLTGSASAVAGGVLLGVARHDQTQPTTFASFAEHDARVRRLTIIGGVNLGVGLALAVAGIVRLGVVSNRRSAPTRQALVVPAVDARGMPMLLVSFCASRDPARLWGARGRRPMLRR